jgi:hypothetical protein
MNVEPSSRQVVGVNEMQKIVPRLGYLEVHSSEFAHACKRASQVSLANVIESACLADVKLSVSLMFQMVSARVP